MSRALRCLVLVTGAIAWGASASPAAAQEGVDRIEARPASLELRAGTSAALEITAYGTEGDVLADPELRFAVPREGLAYEDGRVRALRRGEYEIAVTAVGAAGEREPARVVVPVSVGWPAVDRIEIAPAAGRLYAGTTLLHRGVAFHADDSRRPEAELAWSTSDPSVATVDRFGAVTAHAPGSVRITAGLEGVRAAVEHEVRPLPATDLEIVGGAREARTGDVLTFRARAADGAGDRVPEVPVTWSYAYTPDDSLHAPGAAAIVEDGRFVAEKPGHYTVLATAGPLAARRAVEVRPRDVVQPIEAVGHGPVRHVMTTDLWVWEGTDGRDYAVTGTFQGDGWAYFWDVTDPADIVKHDSIQLDARVVNDVKVSPDGRYAALSREGASDRRNGIVLVDLSDPRDPEIASVYDEGLTGGVHNMFALDDHLFALSAADKYVILDVSDITRPRYVSEYDHPDSRVHDVWVHEGLAYSSEWETGVVIVDVGDGRWGGSMENPVFVRNIPYPVGATHATFPYRQASTGKFYLFVGDEILDRSGMPLEGGFNLEPYDPETGGGGRPWRSAGYIHIIDWTDPDDPRDVARYHVPEAGSHNFWVEDDRLYVAYYEGGLRVVDVSGELKGNLAEQGREIAVYKANDPRGFVPNAPVAFGAQPYGGHIFFSDGNSGLWAVKLRPGDRETGEQRTSTSAEGGSR